CIAIATTLSMSIARAEYIVAWVKEKNLESGASYRKPTMVVIAPKPAARESNCEILFPRSVPLRNPIRAKPVNVKQSALLNDIRVRRSGEPASSRNGHRFMVMSQAPRYWLSVSKPTSATSPPQNRAARRLDDDFGEMRHSHKEESVIAKQKTVAGGIAARLFSDSRPAARVAGAKPRMSALVASPAKAPGLAVNGVVMVSARLSARSSL